MTYGVFRFLSIDMIVIYSMISGLGMDENVAMCDTIRVTIFRHYVPLAIIPIEKDNQYIGVLISYHVAVLHPFNIIFRE